MRRSIGLCLGLFTSVMMAADYQPLADSAFDIVWLPGGRPMQVIIQERKPDGTLVMQVDGMVQTLPRSRYDRVENRILPADVVKNRTQPLLTDRNWNEILRTVTWGISKGAKDESLALAMKALALNPAQVDLAVLALPLLAEKNDTANSEALLQATLKADSHWRDGRKQLVKLLGDAKRDDDLLLAIRDWLQASPTDLEPLRLLATIEEARGNVRAAQEACRKAWESQKDGVSGIAYARLLLCHGETAKALDVANTLAAQDATARPGKAIAGAAQVILGKTAEAEPLLRDASAGELPAELALIAKYDLALCYFRQGKLDEARTLWTAMDLPQARYALAVLDRMPVQDADLIPTLTGAQTIHNAMLVLEHNPAGSLPESLATQTGRQAAFIQQVSHVFNDNSTSDSVRSLAIYPGAVSLRWQAYAHLAAKRYNDALTILDQLPADDGYGLAYRIHIALERKDVATATELWKRLQTVAVAPRDWMARMALVFDAATHDNLIEKFGLESDIPPSGWVFNAPATGIRLHQQGGKLWFEGTQRKSSDQVSRAWRLVKQDAIRRMIVAFDVSGAKGAASGMELLDSQRRNGVAVAIQGDHSLAWRERRNGTWTDWKALALTLPEGQSTFGVDYEGGQAKAFVMEAPDKREKLGDWDGRAQNELSVSVFTAAAPGTAFKVGVDEVRIEMIRRVSNQDDN